MPPDLLSFLNKLPNENTSYKLEWQGTNVDNKYFQLQKKFTSLPFNKLLPLAILLQSLDINLFNEREIYAVANLNIELINSQKVETNTKRGLLKNTKLFDTKSARLYSFIDINFLSKFNLYQANTSYFSGNSLREFITILYNQGY